MTKVTRWWHRGAALAVSAICLLFSVSAFAAADSRLDVFRSLMAQPADKLRPKAMEMVSKHPDDARKLALDLIFYDWARQQFGIDASDGRISMLTAALASTSSDSTVSWAAAVFGVDGWSAAAVPSEGSGSTAQALSTARRELRSAVGFSLTYPARSIESLQNCADALRPLQLDLSNAVVGVKIGERQLNATRQFRDAEASFESALPLFSAYGIRSQAAAIYSDLGRVNNAAGRYDDAYSNYKFAAAEWRALGRGDLAGEEYVRAGLALAAAGNRDPLMTMRSGIEVSSGYAYSEKSFDSYAAILLQAAEWCFANGRGSEAAGLYADAEKVVAERMDDPLLLAKILKEEAAALESIGQSPRARGCLTRRETLLSKIAQEGIEAAAKLRDLTISSDVQSALLTKAERGAMASADQEKHQQAVTLFKQVDEGFAALKMDVDRIRTLREMSISCDAAGDRQAGLIARTQAADIATRTGNLSVAADILGEIAAAALAVGDNVTALEALRESVQVTESIQDMLALARVLEARGALLESMGQRDEAIRDLNKAYAIYNASLGEPWPAAEISIKLASVLADAGKTTEAISTSLDTIKRIEQWADKEGVDPAIGSGRAATLVSIYFNAIRLQALSDRKDDAIKSLRNSTRFAWFPDLRSKLNAAGDAAILALLKELDAYPSQVIAPPVDRPVGARVIANGWRAVITGANGFSRLAGGVRKTFAPAPIDAADIFSVKDKLPDNLAIIEYAMTDTSVQVLIASKVTAVCWDLGVRPEKVTEAVGAYLRATSEIEKRVGSRVPLPPVKDWTDPSLLPMLDPLFSLEESLFAPIYAQLGKATTLAFAVPDELSGVPFQALPRQKSGAVRFLVQDYAVSYLRPGMLRTIYEQHPGPIDAKKARVAAFVGSSRLLPGALIEANAIKRYYANCQIYPDASATSDRFLRSAASSSIIHIVGHHTADPNPSSFGISLSGTSSGASLLQLSDIIKINNPNLQLAVLSACETMGGTDAEAVRPGYIADVFALGGFPSVIGGLWKVSDSASADLISRFYQNLAPQGGKASALRRAQVSMIESKDGKYAHPFYWAAFALYGDPR